MFYPSRPKKQNTVDVMHFYWNKSKVSRAEATEAFYPEHDMEIRFDVNVDMEDIDIINQ